MVRVYAGNGVTALPPPFKILTPRRQIKSEKSGKLTIRRQRTDLEDCITYENFGEVVRPSQRTYRCFRFNTMGWCASEPVESEMLSNSMENTE